MKTFYKLNIVPTIELIAAIILGAIVLPFGFLWAFGKPIYDNIKNKRNFWESIVWFYRYWVNIVIQALHVASYFFERCVYVLKIMFFEFRFWYGFCYLEHTIALSIDLYGNVIAGELIEDIVSPREHTLYGKGKYTISAATGYLEMLGELNKVGIWFTNLLSIVFEPNHCLNAYNLEIQQR